MVTVLTGGDARNAALYELVGQQGSFADALALAAGLAQARDVETHESCPISFALTEICPVTLRSAGVK